MRGRHRVERRCLASGRNPGHRRIGAAPAAAPVLANPAGQDALNPGGAGVRDAAWHGVLRAPRPHRSRPAGGSLGFEAQGHVRGEGRVGFGFVMLSGAGISRKRKAGGVEASLSPRRILRD
ncbi:hypothetical protein SBBP1_1640002 [Burkholderiales bacterium]|nr:hypothetical protein SBBP1_1640002 [Burkholderiales bacterium]